MMKYLLLLVVAVAAHGQYGAATSVVSGNGAPIAAQCTNANNVGRVWARKDGGAASTTFYICAATGAGAFGWQLNDGAIGGAGNIASGQILYGTAAGVAGSNTNFRYFVGTGNMVVGTTTDGNFRLDIAASGSSGTLRVYDQTPTTGVTQLIVRAGAGQSTTNLQTWQDSSGGTAIFASVSTSASALFVRGANATRSAYFGDSGVAAGSAGRFTWSSNTPDNAADLSLSRASANTLQVGDGGSNANGLVYLKGVRPVGSTVANLPAAAGNTGMMATVTDANATTIGTTVAGGGGNTVLVWSNGTNWRIYAN